METSNEIVLSQDKIMREFEKTLLSHLAAAAEPTTKLAAAFRAEEQAIVAGVSEYTPDKIVKNLANLQLTTRGTMEELVTKLENELSQLAQLSQAIQIESERLNQIRKIGIVAEAVAIKERQNAEKMQTLEAGAAEKIHNFTTEMEKTRQDWLMENQLFEAGLEEKRTELKKVRENEAADYDYKLKQKRKIAADEFENRKRKLEQKLHEEGEALGEKWADRQNLLEMRKSEFEANLKLIESFAGEIRKACAAAENEVVAEVNEDAAVTAELLKQEVASAQQFTELQIKSLEEAIGKNNAQIKDLATQLENAQKQVQALAVKTVESTKKTEATLRKNDEPLA
jgi:hypothetical protein